MLSASEFHDAKPRREIAPRDGAAKLRAGQVIYPARCRLRDVDSQAEREEEGHQMISDYLKICAVAQCSVCGAVEIVESSWGALQGYKLAEEGWRECLIEDERRKRKLAIACPSCISMHRATYFAPPCACRPLDPEKEPEIIAAQSDCPVHGPHGEFNLHD